MVTTDVQLLGQTDYYLLDCGRKKNINCRPFTMKAKLSIFCYFVHLVYQFVWKVESSKFFIIIIINFIEIIFTIIARRHLWLRVGGNFFFIATGHRSILSPKQNSDGDIDSTYVFTCWLHDFLFYWKIVKLFTRNHFFS